MADGYGFGAEGDWKTSLLLRTPKAMAADSRLAPLMEDYTYHLEPGTRSRSAPTCSRSAPRRRRHPALEVHPLGIGGREDPVRLVFTPPRRWWSSDWPTSVTGSG